MRRSWNARPINVIFINYTVRKLKLESNINVFIFVGWGSNKDTEGRETFRRLLQ